MIQQRLLVIVAVIFLSACATKQPLPALVPPATLDATVRFSRYMTVKTCVNGLKRCVGPVAKNIEMANTELKLEPSAKNANELTASTTLEVTEEKIPFKADIRVTRKNGADKYTVQATVRSGLDANRKIITKTFTVKDFASFPEIILQDSPVKIKKGTVEGQLIVGPPISASH